MSFEHSPVQRPIGVLESLLEDHEVSECLMDELEVLYPVGFDGDRDAADDASYLVLVHMIANTVSQIDRDPDEDYQIMYQNLYRALQLAMSVGLALRGGHLTLDVQTTAAQLMSGKDDMLERLLEIGQYYLDDRPELDATITCYAGSIATSSEYDYRVACMSGFWLKMIDEGYEIEQFKVSDGY